MTPSTLNILIVDDDDGDRKLVRRALKQAGLACECAESASMQEAIEACDKVAFDCAIVDYWMPGYDGLQGITALRQRLPLMPIIMATGHGDETIATEAMKRGATDYITKSHINAESIRRSVENALENAALRRKVAQQREELENFARVLAHDLSAPIASLQIFARAIAEDINSVTIDKDEIADSCREIVSAGQRAGELIDTLYEYTRADAKVAFEPVEMRQVMEDTLVNLSAVIQERGARVTHGELPAVIGNAPQLMQLLQNLIANSIKFCEAKPPTVDVAASRDRGDKWRFSVKDNGIGIAEKEYDRAFEPFKRLHDTGKYPGTGLGLATCKKIVERHGGVIWVESKVGEGTTFFFTLQGARK